MEAKNLVNVIRTVGMDACRAKQPLLLTSFPLHVSWGFFSAITESATHCCKPATVTAEAMIIFRVACGHSRTLQHASFIFDNKVATP
jgi:hypothetical protein